MQLTLEVPEKYLVNQTPEELALLLKLNTAIDLYKNGRLSAGAAAEFIGEIDRYAFLYECKKKGR
jgi:predicted HTH domain antitoxin